MAQEWAGKIGLRANNSRSQQITNFKKIWLSCNSPYAIVTYVTNQDLQVKDRPMKVAPEVVASGLKTVADVRKCLKSENMYLNPVMYNLLCSGIESGKLKQSTKQQPSSLRCLITVAHEAHLRLELYFQLKRQRFHHDPAIKHGEYRITMWKQFCEIVHSDRERNAEQAERTRGGSSLAQQDDTNDDSVDDEEDGTPLVNKKYY